jgi:hypothetical protein
MTVPVLMFSSDLSLGISIKNLWTSTSIRISDRDYDSILKTTLGDIIIDDERR